MNKGVQQSDISSADDSHSLNRPLAVRHSAPYSSPVQQPRSACNAISGGHHDILNAFPHPLLSLFKFSFSDRLASAEIEGETHPQPVTSTFQAPGPRDEDTNTYEGSLMISGDTCPPAIENAHTEMSTNSVAVFPNSKDSISPVMFPASSEEIEPERATAESSWPHHFASAGASATSSTPPPIDLEAAPIEGTLSW